MVVSSRVAVIAHWSTSTRVTRSVCALVHELQSFGYRVIVSSACEASDDLFWDDAVSADDLVVIRKPNVGYDFGSWSVAFRLMPEIARADRVIVANDSMAGPFLSLRPLLEQFDDTTADVWGLTDSMQFEHHLQSYFLGFCDGVLGHRSVRGFWASISDEREKLSVILRNEIGLSRLLREEGYLQMPAFPHESVVRPGQNPVIVGWKRLLEDGFPFLKREILRNPMIAPAGRTAPEVVRNLLHVDVGEWVDDECTNGDTTQSNLASVTAAHPLRRVRRALRPRTRWRAMRSRRRGAAVAKVLGWPADFDAWVDRASSRQMGEYPDAWKNREDLPVANPANVGVVLHAFHYDLLPDLFERLRRVPVPYDLWITNATGTSIELPRDFGRASNVRVVDVENRGRDILPLISLVNGGYLDPYVVILKVHTKRSPWRADHATLRGDGTSWRVDLLDAVLGDEDDIAAILSAFSEQPDLGLVTSDSSILGSEFWGDNQTLVANLLRRIELTLDPARLRFPAGSMYWVRGFALQGLRALNLGADDFEVEQGQVNVTTAHAVERAIGILVDEAGLSLVGRSTVKRSSITSYRRLREQNARPRARIVPFYLPQFHPVPENDRWWGNGFTEWANVTATRPVYYGQYQPRLPRDLGFYDLRLDEVRRAQRSLATDSGIAGFMYYYYWFAGRRLLETPIEALVDSNIPQPFCIMWANENWTRRWDGREDDVLIAQDYDRVPTEVFIEDILPFLADDRYMTINGRKLVAIYRPGQIPGLAGVVESWRVRAKEAGVGELFVISADVGEGFQGIRGTPGSYGLDGSLGFPPHNHQWQWLVHDGLAVDDRFRGNILDYSALVEGAETRLRAGLASGDFPGVMVAFDNTPRRQWMPDIWYGSNPYTFRRWLATAVESVADRSPDERLVFVNAWNEWAEGAVLEPTDRFGRTFLLALRDVVLA